MKKTILITLLCLCAISTQGYAQSETENTSLQKKPLTPEDYKLWSTISGHSISNNGDWYTYQIYNAHSKEKTLTVGSTKGTIKYDFPNGSGHGFSPGSKWYAYTDKEKGFGLLDLEKGTTQWLSNISSFDFIEDTYLIGYTKPTETIKEKSLFIRDLSTGKQELIPNVIEYAYNTATNQLAYIIDTEVSKSVNLRTLETKPITTRISENNTSHKYMKLRWNTKGNTLIFLQELPGKFGSFKLYCYNDNQGSSKLKSLDTTKDPSLFGGGMNISIYDHKKPIKATEDGATIFFAVEGSWDRTTTGVLLDDNVEIWNTKDKIFGPKLKEEVYDFGPWLAAWWPGTGKTLIFGNKDLPETMVDNTGKYLLSYNPMAYAPFFTSEGDTDLYITDLETGERSLFLKQQHYMNYGHRHYYASFSPEGKYIKYFRDRHWWIYDLKKKTHANVTRDLGVQFNNDAAFPGTFQSHGSPGWTTGDKALVIYDSYDVWFISPKGKAQRLTKGREKQIRYRVDPNSIKDDQINTSNGLVFKAFGTTDIASGYAIWKPKKGLEDIVYKDMNVSSLKKAKDREAYIYLEESCETSPRLRYWEQGMSESRILVETNLHQNQFQWGRSELIKYTDDQGNPLQGVLFYPANYKAGKQYPMIVYVYETLSGSLHNYNIPTEDLADGFNRSHYTSAGYFVFTPDIKYTFNDVGMSAVRCIEAGVKAVLKKRLVEADHVGLIGHSFGGYETAFTITQSNLFATAVAGAANTDLISNYHSIAFGDSNMSRTYWYESQQYRFSDSFYENPEAYYRNSPLHQIQGIHIPLLLWTGKEDVRVDWHQSIELFTGLRRLGKPCELLLYPGEGHNLYKPENRLDLTRRIKAWFDTYLKPGQSLKRTER